MSRLPNPGSDDDVWGNILNDYLSQSTNPDGSLKPSALTASGAALDSAVVHNTNAETVAGVKTFSSNINVTPLNTGGVVKAASSTGQLSLATAGTDYENPLTFNNGLSRSTNTVGLGGTLAGSTDVDLASNNLTLSGAGTSGKLSIGGAPTTFKLSMVHSGGDGIALNVNNSGNRKSQLVFAQQGSQLFTICTDPLSANTQTLAFYDGVGNVIRMILDSAGRLIVGTIAQIYDSGLAAPNNARFQLVSTVAGEITMLVRAASGQSVDIFVIQSSGGTALARITNKGKPAFSEAANGAQGVVTLVGGTATVSNTSVTANSRILLTVQSLGTVSTPQAVAVTARSAGTSFTITSASASDTSVVAYLIVEPA